MKGIAIDLKAAADSLPSEFAKIAGMIRSLSSAHSIRMDIEVAYDMVQALEVVLPQARLQSTTINWASNAALALLNSAIVMYVRATKSSSKHRGSINFLKDFTPSERETHDLLVELRDDAIAHFGPGEIYNGPTWQHEGVSLPLDDPNDMRVMTASHRVIMQKQLQERMHLHFHRCLMIAERETQKRNAALVVEMNANVEDGTLLAELHKHQVDLIDFFETEEARDNALGGLRRGRRSGVVDH